MSNDPINAPAARSWRDIPQPVKPRTMSRGGRWRLVLAVLRTVLGFAFLAGVAWGGWSLVEALQETPGAMPAAAKAVPVKLPELRTNGVLDHAWLARALALPRGASLLELDLEKLRNRLLADGQVLTAVLTRNFPDRLVATVTERSPIAKVMAEWKDRQQPLLVAGDGVIFAGEGFDPAMLEVLPWLDGVALVRRGGAFRPIEGMGAVAELLAKAREADPRVQADAMWRTWRVISLARLASDRELEVRTPRGVTIVFAANGDLFRQVAKLDLLWDTLTRATDSAMRIDLSLGREVPVMVEPAAAKPESGRLAPTFFPSSQSQSNPRREL